VRALTAGRMMRRETQATPVDTNIAAFRHRFPLGSANRAVLIDSEGRYKGIVVPATAYADGLDESAPVSTLAEAALAPLSPGADIAAVMARFDADQVDELAVVDEHGVVLGVLSERFARKRYAEELEKAQRELFGE